MSSIRLLKKIGCCLLLCMTLFACRKQPQIPANKVQEESVAEDMMKLNKLLAEVEQQDINEYIAKQKLQPQADSMGFWYIVTKPGNGKAINKGTTVEIGYSLELLDGTICFDTKKNGNRTLVIGKVEDERGLNMALEKLTENAEATLIIPSHLAFGVLGNHSSVPPRSPVIYRINYLKIK
jgi:FKBP-type peptidyl-prolyl cis-trans isomerase FkpA